MAVTLLGSCSDLLQEVDQNRETEFETLCLSNATKINLAMIAAAINIFKSFHLIISIP